MTASLITPEIHPDFDVPLIHEVLYPGRTLWSARQLRELTTTVADELTSPLLSVLRFAEGQRWWSRLALTGGVELWLLSWLPGQGTKPHDHSGASGAFTVVLGQLAENYRYPGGPVRTRRHTTGASVAFGPERAHEVRNPSSMSNAASMTNAASVHAYSPPLMPVRNYASLRDLPDVDTVAS
jgi:hypothetical protein